LNDEDIPALLDKRQGQKHDYQVTPEVKAEIIQQYVARIVTGRSASSDGITEVVNEQTQKELSPRTVRWHIQKLGLQSIKKTLPKLLDALKKNS
jgi:PIN domain nuclease of toxin-antitoxin system